MGEKATVKITIEAEENYTGIGGVHQIGYKVGVSPSTVHIKKPQVHINF